MAGVLAEGKTIIRNANTRPEVLDLIHFLNEMGGNIKYKTRYVEIEGVNRLRGGEYRILGGRDEAITYMILAAMCRGEVKINDFTCENVKTDINLLREIGLEIYEWNDDTYVSAKNKQLKPFSMATAPYPGINSDMQPLFAALAATIEGESIITDMRFLDRFQYVSQYKKFGIDIDNYSNCAIVTGGKSIQGAKVQSPDLRGGAALVLLGCVADGVTEIENEYQIERGYIDIEKKLNNIGCSIKKV
jgi:UDP-N-acetylglucosamine 1-carboxyvinyltransferase